MKSWTKPEFVEIRMDAEINCYSSALDDTGRRPIPKKSAEEKTNGDIAEE
jgi:coenzyme PQQ precursor peptide PqqA